MRHLLGVALKATGLCLAFVLLAFALAGAANAWGLQDVNKVIDQTNFLVGDGCSGTLISIEDRHILTAEHCVARLTTFVEEDEIQPDGTVKKVKRYYRKPLQVSQSRLDENGNIVGTTVYRAKIVRTQKKQDLALLQIVGPVSAEVEAPVLAADGEIVRGETIYLVGNPMGVLEGTLTKGIVSHLKRELPGSSGPENDVKFLQIDSGSAPGNSGGGIFNENGEIISVLVRGANGYSHLGFGVDIDDIRAFLKTPATPSYVNYGPGL